jgi:hypothetical protein
MGYLGSESQCGSTPSILPAQPDGRECDQRDRAAQHSALRIGDTACCCDDHEQQNDHDREIDP